MSQIQETCKYLSRLLTRIIAMHSRKNVQLKKGRPHTYAVFHRLLKCTFVFYLIFLACDGTKKQGTSLEQASNNFEYSSSSEASLDSSISLQKESDSMKTANIITAVVATFAINSFGAPLVPDTSDYSKTGTKDGAWETFYENGKVETKGAYRNGKLEGVYETYYENGKILCKGAYNNGKKQGLFEFYYDNEKVWAKVTYGNDAEEGLYEEYYKNGKPKMKGSFKNGYKEGGWESFFENGKTESKGTFSRNKPEGVYEEYYDNGQLKLKGSYQNGIKQGVWESYYSNGKTKSKGAYSTDRYNDGFYY